MMNWRSETPLRPLREDARRARGKCSALVGKILNAAGIPVAAGRIVKTPCELATGNTFV